LLVFQHFDNPYVGIVVFVVIPAGFVVGLLLMPLGLVLAARRPGTGNCLSNYRTAVHKSPDSAG
jgi:hypothetical protein